MFKLEIKAINLILQASLIFLVCQNVFADWQSDLEGQFNIVDIFDNYADWTGDAPDNGCVEHAWGGRWGYHCYYERDQDVCQYPRPTVVTNHGNDKVVTGKSVRLSHSGMGGLDCGECSTVRFYAGDGSQNSGLNDFYIFMRFYFPKTLFPTWAYDDTDHTKRCYDIAEDPDPVVCHVEGKQYCDTDSWKWLSISLGFIDANTWSDLGIISNSCRYGVNETQFYIGGGASQNYEKRVLFYAPESMGGTFWGDIDITPYFGKMVGVEFHLKRESVIGADDGLVEVWFYDENGSATKVMEKTNAKFIDPNSSCVESLSQDEADNVDLEHMKFNRVMVESNKRLINTLNYNAGSLYNESGQRIGDMEAVWYMDDFIVNDSRIGLTYFTMLNNQNVIRADVDQSGNISSTDAMLTIRNSLGLDMLNTNWQSSTTTGDVNCDGVSNSTDAMLILRYSLGLDMSGTGWCE